MDTASCALERVIDQLYQCGLRIDPDKTEFITFQPSRAKPHLIGTPVEEVPVKIPYGPTFTIKRAKVVRYLGIFIQDNLRWEHHAKIMACHAESTIRGLILGNSVRGLSLPGWRIVFNAVILPILTYGFQLWSFNAPQSLFNIFQVAQNTAIRKIAGVFRTSPTDALHNLVAIPPFKFTIAKLRESFTERFSRLPPTARLRTILVSDPTAYARLSFTIPTPLSSLQPATFKDFYIAEGTTWNHDRVLVPKGNKDQTLLLANSSPPDRLSILIYPLPHPSHHAAACLLFRDGTVAHRGHFVAPDKLTAQCMAAIFGVQHIVQVPQHLESIAFFLPNKDTRSTLLRRSKHKHLPQSSLFQAVLNVTLIINPDAEFSLHVLPIRLAKERPYVDPRLFCFNWPGPAHKDYHLGELRALAVRTTLDPDVAHPLKTLAFRLWAEDQDHNPDRAVNKWTGSPIPTPPSSQLPDPIKGALLFHERRATSLFAQVFLQHCFCGAYSTRFRPGAPDNRTCPCSFDPTPLPVPEPVLNGWDFNLREPRTAQEPRRRDWAENSDRPRPAHAAHDFTDRIEEGNAPTNHLRTTPLNNNRARGQPRRRRR